VANATIPEVLIFLAGAAIGAGVGFLIGAFLGFWLGALIGAEAARKNEGAP
jgi:hypothetical protein